MVFIHESMFTYKILAVHRAWVSCATTPLPCLAGVRQRSMNPQLELNFFTLVTWVHLLTFIVLIKCDENHVEWIGCCYLTLFWDSRFSCCSFKPSNRICRKMLSNKIQRKRTSCNEIKCSCIDKLFFQIVEKYLDCNQVDTQATGENFLVASGRVILRFLILSPLPLEPGAQRLWEVEQAWWCCHEWAWLGGHCPLVTGKMSMRLFLSKVKKERYWSNKTCVMGTNWARMHS